MSKKKITIRWRLTILVSSMICLLLVVGGMGLLGMTKTKQDLLIMYENSVVPFKQMSDVQRLLFINRLNLAIYANDRDTVDAAKRLGSITDNDARIDRLWAAYTDNEFLSAGDAQLTADFARELGVLRGKIEQSIAERGDLSVTRLDRLYKPLDDALDALMTMQVDDAELNYASTTSHFEATRSLTIILMSAGVIAALWLGISMVRSILFQLGNALQMAGTVARGNLTTRIEVTTNDEIGKLLGMLNSMADGLHDTIGRVRTASDSIRTAANEIAHGNADLSSRTENQAASLEETASSVDELTQTARQNSENAARASKLAVSASDVAAKGGEVVEGVVVTMTSISDSSKKMADIIAVIEGIAFQTNILALNAAVEAARAGEQGRGFAVVAGEVRSLAQRAATASGEIRELIEDSVRRVGDGATQADQAGRTMREVVLAIRSVTDLMGEISEASREQSAGIEQVNAAINQMDEVTQRNAALVEEAAASTELLRDEADALMKTVSFFDLKHHNVRGMPAATTQ